MSINFVLLSCRNCKTGDYAPGIIPLCDIDTVATPDVKDAERFKGAGAIIFFKKEAKLPKPVQCGNPLEMLMGRIEEIESSHRSSVTALETPVEIYKKMAEAGLGIIDTKIPMTLTQQQAADRMQGKGCEKGPNPIIIDDGGEPETNAKPV